MLTKEDFTNLNFNIVIANKGGIEFIYQEPFNIAGVENGSHATKLGHPVLLIDHKIHKVKDFDEAIKIANEKLTIRPNNGVQQRKIIKWDI